MMVQKPVYQHPVKVKWLGVIGALVNLLFAVSVAQAGPLTPEILFDGFGSGTDTLITYDGNGGTLEGWVSFEKIAGLNTEKDGTTLDCIGCILHFETGLLKPEGESLNNSTGLPWFTSSSYEFYGGGTFTLTGEAWEAYDTDGARSITHGEVELLTGSFNAPVMVNALVLMGSSLFSLNIVSSGFDTKNGGLVDFFGIDSNAFEFVFTVTADAGAYTSSSGGFTATGPVGDITNTAVPEPASVLLMGSGLFVLAMWRRMKRGGPRGDRVSRR